MRSEPKRCDECRRDFSPSNLRKVVGLNNCWGDDQSWVCLCCAAKALAEERLEPSRESQVALAQLVQEGLVDRGKSATKGDRVSRQRAIRVLSCPSRQRRWLTCLVGRSVA